MQPFPASRWLPAMLVALIGGAGCQLVGTGTLTGASPSAISPAADTKHPTRAMSVEVLFVRCSADDGLTESIWDHVDEQAIGSDVARALNANGVRAGIVSGHLPAEFERRLASAADDEIAEVSTIDPSRSRRLLQLLPGRRSELLTASRVESLVMFERHAGEVVGNTFHDATPLWSIEARPAADGRIRFSLVPEVKHGPVEKEWIGEDGMFRLETGQRRHRMDHLTIDVMLPPGDSLFIGTAGDAATTVGDGLLRDRPSGTTRLMVVRPMARSVDPVFADDATASDASPE